MKRHQQLKLCLCFAQVLGQLDIFHICQVISILLMKHLGLWAIFELTSHCSSITNLT